MDNLLVHSASLLRATICGQTTPCLHALVHRFDWHLVKGGAHVWVRINTSDWLWWRHWPIKYLPIWALRIATRCVSLLRASNHVFVSRIHPFVLVRRELILRKWSRLRVSIGVCPVLRTSAKGLLYWPLAGATLWIGDAWSCCMLGQRTPLGFIGWLELASWLFRPLVLLTVQSIGFLFAYLITRVIIWVCRRVGIAIFVSHRWANNDLVGGTAAIEVITAQQDGVIGLLDLIALIAILIIFIIVPEIECIALYLSIWLVAGRARTCKHLLLLFFQLWRILNLLGFILVKLVFFISV